MFPNTNTQYLCWNIITLICISNEQWAMEWFRQQVPRPIITSDFRLNHKVLTNNNLHFLHILHFKCSRGENNTGKSCTFTRTWYSILLPSIITSLRMIIYYVTFWNNIILFSDLNDLSDGSISPVESTYLQNKRIGSIDLASSTNSNETKATK